MNKSQLIAKLAEQGNISSKKAEEAVNVFFNEIERALVQGERVELRGLGSFKVKDYEGYQGRNPKNGEKIQVPPKRMPFFKAGKDLKHRVDF